MNHLLARDPFILSDHIYRSTEHIVHDSPHPDDATCPLNNARVVHLILSYPVLYTQYPISYWVEKAFFTLPIFSRISDHELYLLTRRSGPYFLFIVVRDLIKDWRGTYLLFRVGRSVPGSLDEKGGRRFHLLLSKSWHLLLPFFVKWHRTYLLQRCVGPYLLPNRAYLSSLQNWQKFNSHRFDQDLVSFIVLQDLIPELRRSPHNLSQNWAGPLLCTQELSRMSLTYSRIEQDSSYLLQNWAGFFLPIP
jgi:hypothetical protein